MSNFDYKQNINQMRNALDNIEEIYTSNLNIKDKHQLLSKMWSNYYVNLYILECNKCDNLQEVKDMQKEAYNLYLRGENESFCLEDIELNYKKIMDEPNSRDILNKGYVTSYELNLILKYAVWLSWNFIAKFVSDIKNNSLNGYCEIAQFLSMRYLENLGLKVWKNSVFNTFKSFKHQYNLNHAFGMVEFVVLENNHLEKRRYLIDPTYKQFFSTLRTNDGVYFKNDNGFKCIPDPGYFMDNEDEQMFSRSLIKNGFVIANDKNIKYYADGFLKASVPLENLDDIMEIDNISSLVYIDEIINNDNDYALDNDERMNLGK